MKTLIRNIGKLVGIVPEGTFRKEGEEMGKVGYLDNAWLLIDGEKIDSFGQEGDKSDLDYKLRPCIDEVNKSAHPELAAHIRKLAQIRRGSAALCYGGYAKATVMNRNFSFVREYEGEKIVVAVNIADSDCTVRVEEAEGTDLLTGQVRNLNDIYLPPFSASIYRRN